MTRIYTKTGDDGTTGLIGGKRITKDAVRVEAYGTIDELNAVLGVARSLTVPAAVDEVLRNVQNRLFTIGAILALPEGLENHTPRFAGLKEGDVSALERAIDEHEAGLEALHQFILPDGKSPAAMLHLARAVARRAERRCVSLARLEKLDPLILQYLNRLSDLCFVLARSVNQASGHPEGHPTFERS